MIFSMLMNIAVHATNSLKYHCVDLTHDMPVKNVFLYKDSGQTYTAKCEQKDKAQVLTFSKVKRKTINRRKYQFTNDDLKIEFGIKNSSTTRRAKISIKSLNFFATNWACKPYK